LPTKKDKSIPLRLQWWEERIGQLALSELSSDLVNDHRLSPKRSGRAAGTVNRYLTVLSSVLTFAVKELRWLDQNPARAEVVARYEEPIGRKRVIKPKEWETILRAADDFAKKDRRRRYQMLPNYLRLLWETVARRAELLELCWEDVDLDAGVAVLFDDKAGHGREIYLTDTAVEMLREHAARFRVESCPWVFPGRSPRKPTALDHAWREVRKAAGIKADRHGENIGFHTIRHTRATALGNAGATEAELMAVGGWKTPGMVKRYCNSTKEQAYNAFAKLGTREAK